MLIERCDLKFRNHAGSDNCTSRYISDICLSPISYGRVNFRNTLLLPLWNSTNHGRSTADASEVGNDPQSRSPAGLANESSYSQTCIRSSTVRAWTRTAPARIPASRGDRPQGIRRKKSVPRPSRVGRTRKPLAGPRSRSTSDRRPSCPSPPRRTRPARRALSGLRPFGHRKTAVTLRTGGVIATARLDGSTSGERFRIGVIETPAPALTPGDAVIPDDSKPRSRSVGMLSAKVKAVCRSAAGRTIAGTTSSPRPMTARIRTDRTTP